MADGAQARGRPAAHGPEALRMLAQSLRRAVGEGVRRMDFLRGREPYKYAWGAVDQPRWRSAGAWPPRSPGRSSGASGRA